jgi:hypothetical protein
VKPRKVIERAHRLGERLKQIKNGTR